MSYFRDFCWGFSKKILHFVYTLAFEGIALKTGRNIPSNIISCYENQTLYNRASRLPSTMNSLISLIAKVEKAGGMNMDMRSLTAAILHQ